MGELRSRLVSTGPQSEELCGPPLLALSALATHLPKIAKLEKFDPRDHEATKVARLRAHLRGAYGSPLRSPLWLADLFDPEDAEVRRQNYNIYDVAIARIEKMCQNLRLEPEIAEADPDVTTVMEEFGKAAKIFDAALEAFDSDTFSERRILLHTINTLGLDTSSLPAELWASFEKGEDLFLATTGLPRQSLKDLRLHQRVKWRIEDAILQLRDLKTKDLRVQKAASKDEFDVVKVWSLGEWANLKGRAGAVQGFSKRPAYGLWTDGATWKIFEEKLVRRRHSEDSKIGVLFEEGRVTQGSLPASI